jgi:threonine dehydrogenase-like Zn-dependent dehydrogenase
MRQVLIERARVVKIADVPEPKLTPETVLARTRCCSLLMENVAEFIGTDPRLYKEGHLYYHGYPYVMDSEVVVEVTAVGDQVKGLAVGNRLASYAKCNEWHVLRPGDWIKLSPEVSDEAAVSLPFGATSLQCVRRAQVGLGDNVIILGQGPMGLLVTHWVSLTGAGQVIVADRYARRLEVARQMGATTTLNASEVEVAGAVRELTGGAGADIVIDAGNTPQTFALALEVAREKGRVVVLSFHTKPITIEDITRDFYHKELDVLATRATGPGNSYRSPYVRWTSGENMRLVERFIAQGRLHPERLITGRLPLAQIEAGLKQVETEPDRVVKLLMEW